MEDTDVAATTTLMGVLFGLVREMRPQQWYKQLLLLVGVVFSKNLFVLTMIWDVILGIIAFCAAAGSIYIFNDIIDVEADRKHPSKRHRPIASGQVDIPIAAGFGVILLVFALGFGYLLNTLFLLVLLLYLSQNILYSIYLKEIAFVDVIIVAIGYVLRAIAGVVIIRVPLSAWLIVSTFLLALVLALAKRRHELELDIQTRRVFNIYSVELLDRLIMVVVTVLLVSYSLYSFFASSNYMLFTLPFVYFGIFRFFYILHETEKAPRPLMLLHDRAFLLNLLCWIGVVLAVLYAPPYVEPLI